MPEIGARLVKQQLASPELQQILACHALKSLSCKNLAALACSCPDLRGVAYSDDSIWAAAAASFLPPHHPSVSGLERAAIQSILQRRADACKLITSGGPYADTGTTIKHGTFKLDQLKDLHDKARTIEGDPVFAHNGKQELFRREHQEFVQFLTSGKRALLRTPYSQDKPTMTLSVWDLDQQATVSEVTMDWGELRLAFDDRLVLAWEIEVLKPPTS
ncbi:hypothetical protein WJX73_010499 [Symbiochloris irregularis]|uniref:Uncharacterized protein n=1 Tax=Symbiochloris irregularis TaxID=706552 RepID=A0AAW1P5K8_9CHLO